MRWLLWAVPLAVGAAVLAAVAVVAVIAYRDSKVAGRARGRRRR